MLHTYLKIIFITHKVLYIEQKHFYVHYSIQVQIFENTDLKNEMKIKTEFEYIFDVNRKKN